jgi:23S rRNA (uracil1939-C5)-methyltransferase
VNKNDQLIFHIQRVSNDFSGIAVHNGRVTFIPFALPGETVWGHVVSVKKRHAFAKALEIENPSAERIEPPCPHFRRCGGCSCQHVAYEATLSYKQQAVRDHFERIAKLSVPVLPVVAADNPYGYRNKTTMPVQQSKEERLIAGFYAPRSHRLIEVKDCPLSMPQSLELSNLVLSWANKNGVSAYDEETGQGLLRHIVTRVNQKGQSMLTLVINGRELPHQNELLTKLAGYQGLVSVNLSINQEEGNVILGDQAKNIWGQSHLEERLLGIDFRLSPHSFFQVNTPQAERLFSAALAMSGVSKNDTVADIYCGTGTLSLLFAPHAKEVVGIEIVDPAVQDAKKNAINNQINNTSFFTGAAEEVLPAMVKDGFRPSIVLLDPPRKGVDVKVLDAVIASGADRIVYISCYPATQARDCAYLAEHGYTPSKCQPVDMFPQTEHVETVVLLQKADF